MFFSRFVIAARLRRRSLRGHMPAISSRRIGHSPRFWLEYFRLDEKRFSEPSRATAPTVDVCYGGNYPQLSFRLGSILITAIGFTVKNTKSYLL